MKKELSIEEKQAYCIAFEKSGMKQSAFCRANNLAPSTFHGWYAQHQKQQSETGLFSPMVQASPAVTLQEPLSVHCELRFPNHTQMFLSVQEKTLISIIGGLSHATTAPW